jgi:tetratricopeptide (TPR) repeat protein
MGHTSGNTVIWLAVALSGAAAVFGALAFFGGGNGGHAVAIDWEARVQQAVELQNNKLYQAAINEFAGLVENPAIPPEKRANFAYTIGEIYQDQLGDYENAAAAYVRARSIGVRPALESQLGQRLVECFENLGRSFDAARQLSNYTTDDESQKAAPGEIIVASIGEREITLSEIERELQKLPTALQTEFATPVKKLEFVRQFVGMELLYKSALRRGLDRQPELMAQFAELKRQLILEEMLQTEVVGKINISDADLDLFYQAHKTDLFGDKPKNEVSVQLQQEYMRLKQREKYAELIDKLITTEPVTIYEKNIK